MLEIVLKDGGDLVAAPDDLTDARRSLCREVAQLDTATGIDSDRLGIGWVVWFQPQFHRLSALADFQFETARGASLVWIISADDGQRELREGHRPAVR